MSTAQQRKTAGTVPPGNTPPPPGRPGRGIPLLRGRRPSAFRIASGLLILLLGMSERSAVLVVLGILWFALPAMVDWLIEQGTPRAAGRGARHHSRAAWRQTPGGRAEHAHLRRIK